MCRTKQNSIAAVSLALVAWSLPAAAQERDINVARSRVNVSADDVASVRAAGAQVTITGTVRDSIMAAGALVDIKASTGGDLSVAGAQVNVEGDIGGQARLAAADLKFSAKAHGSLNGFAASIEIVEGARVGPNSSLAAALVDFRGGADDNLSVSGDEVVFSGQASGSVVIEARKVRITDKAKIDGDLTIRSIEAADIATTATIGGDLAQSISETPSSDEQETETRLSSTFAFAVSTLLLGFMILLFAGASAEQAIVMMRSRPGWSMLWGLAAFLGVPIAALLAMVTIVGIPIGLFALLAYPFVLLLGVAAAILGVSDFLFNRSAELKSTRQRLLYLFAGVAMLAVASLIPFLGRFVLIGTLLLGLGAAAVTIQDRLSARR